jgi:hypothetical protein
MARSSSIVIPPLTEPVHPAYNSFKDFSDPKAFDAIFDPSIERIRHNSNWRVRKKGMLDLLEQVYLITRKGMARRAASLAVEQTGEQTEGQTKEQTGEQTEEQTEERAEEKPREESSEIETEESLDVQDSQALNEEVITAMLTVGGFLIHVVGEILMRLKEPAIHCPEQAVYYMMSSCHEHRAAAEAWVEASFANKRALRKLVQADRRLNEMLELLLKTHDMVRKLDPELSKPPQIQQTGLREGGGDA